MEDIGVIPALVAVKEGTLPVPESGANPIAPAVLLHEKVAPGTLLPNTTEGTMAPAQYVILATGFTVGFGLIVMVNCMGVPVQVTPFAVNEATTEKVAVIGPVEVLVAVNAGTLPVPLVGKVPMSGVGTVLDQEKTAPGVLLVKTTDGTAEPAQYVIFDTGSTWGTGFTFTVAVAVAEQPAPLVTVTI